MRLTDKVIKSVTPPTHGYRIDWDSELPGFGLRTTAGGVNAFVYNYRTKDGRSRRATVGRWPGLTATAARARAAKLRNQVDDGGDPVAAGRERREAMTVSQLIEEFEERYLISMKAGTSAAAYLRRDAMPVLGRLKAAEVSRRDILALVENKAADGPSAANSLLSAIRRMYNWAIRRDILDNNPCLMVQKLPEKSRDRVLSETELRIVWNRLGTADRVSRDIRDAARLILLTLARPGEVCGMSWEEIDGDAWEISGARTKNGRSHRIPLNDLAREILSGRPRERDGTFVFTSTKHADHLQRMSLSQSLRRSQLHFGLPAFRPHDLRRTAASHIAGLRVPRFVVERLLGHIDSSVTAIYDRYEYADEKAAALAKWDRKLRAILTGERAEVVEFSR